LKFYTHIADEDSKAHMFRLFPMPVTPKAEVENGTQEGSKSTASNQFPAAESAVISN
jgi:hypothetical protein